ncbi:hypothetical protein POPTR_014G117800v4 [Populus trichocarpa]|uniref:Uncharacterized protein n=1 Tax=Populus trichocarpa TaxID=3694 RepID=A0ACC0RYF8_POPTR|nr:DUF724 domain-containing protein 2 isoform X3 [Populus trichocarpa]KAI9382321.1 hypothetical protein POPTR_014G117800v4 [Populus trichocarpa]
MAGLDSNPQPQQNPHQQNQTSTVFFNKGEEVEVSSEQEGFRGAWYLATILDFPTPSQPQSASEKKRKAIVQYKTLVTEDGPAPLLEQVDPQLIRPLPPQDSLKNGGVFQENEAIDASLRYGWWSGVVKKVLDRGARYMVYFDNPPDVLDFDAKDLRIHLDWVDGKWVRPEMQQEVRILSDSRGQFGSTNNNKNPDVAELHKSSSASEDKTKEKTVSTSIRNMPEQSTHLGEKSAKKPKPTLFNCSGMRSNPSSMLIEIDATEAPLSVSALQSRNIPIEMSSNEMLCGFTSSKTGGKRTRCIEKLVDAQPSNKTENSSAGKATMQKTKQLKVLELDCQKVEIITRIGRVTKSPFRSPNASAAVKDGNAVDVAVQGISEIDFKTKEIEVPFIMGLKATEGIYQDDKETLKLLRDQKKSLNDSAKDKNLEHVGSSQRRKRGRPCKLTINSKASVTSREDLGSGDIADEVVQVVVKDLTTNEVEWLTQARMEPKVSQNSSRERTSEVSKTDFMSREVDAAVAAASKNVADDDQPLSTWFGGVHASTSLGELRSSTGRAASGGSEAREKQAVAVESCTIDAKGNDTLVENQSVPFVKRSPVWNTIESMEVFRAIPQKLHFHPLTECKEEYREGSAIGIMVTFASLFDKITSLQFDDCRSILESTLESLLDLEKHGFDITVPRGRLNELLSIKDGQGEVLNESKDAEGKLRVHTDEKRKLEEKRNDIEKKITELQEELALTKAKMGIKNLDLSKLQSHANAINERIKNARDHFGKVASAPWNPP